LAREFSASAYPTADGVETRSLYPSHADALAAASDIRTLRAMGCLAAGEW
jgi:hypothetical protein